MKRAVKKGDTDYYDIQELKPMETETGTVDVWVTFGTYNEDQCDSELTSLQDQQDNLTDRVDELDEIKELIDLAKLNE